MLVEDSWGAVSVQWTCSYTPTLANPHFVYRAIFTLKTFGLLLLSSKLQHTKKSKHVLLDLWQQFWVGSHMCMIVSSVAGNAFLL